MTGVTLLSVYLGCSAINDRVHHHSEIEVVALLDWMPLEFLYRLGDVAPRSEIGDESDTCNGSKDTDG